MNATPPWEAVRDHARLTPMQLAHHVPLVRMERVGDTSATGTDMVVVLDADDAPEPPEEVALWRGDEPPTDIAPAMVIEYGHAEVRNRDERAIIVVRTPTGEYRACPLMPRDYTPEEWLEIHALLHQRGRVTRESALPVPVEAGALQRMMGGGRDHAARAEAISERIRVKVEKVFDSRKRELVTVELVVPKVRGMQLRIRAEHPIFPELAGADKRELPTLVGEALARALPSVRAYQAVLAGMSLVFKEGATRLEDCELSNKFRLEVMRVMGMPSRTASAAQRQLVRNAMQFLVHAEVLVKPTDGERPDYLPILVRHGYADDPNQPERRPSLLALNPELMPAMDSGHRWLVPEALFQVSDDADRDGVTRLLGFQLAHRLGMGTSGHEKLEKMLRRAGLWEWAQKQARVQRGTYVMDTLRRALDELRALPHAGHAPTDIVGGTVILGTELSNGRVEYHDAPPWTRSSD